MPTSSRRTERAASDVWPMPIQRNLAFRRIRSRQPAVGGTPDAADTASSANEQRCRCQTHKSKQQRVLDQVLALFVLDEVVKKRIHVDTSKFFRLMSRMFRLSS